MASGPEHDIAQVNKLIAVTVGSGKDRNEMGERLQARVKALGGEAAQAGALNLNKGPSAEGSEKRLIEAYQAAVLDTELSDPVRMAIESEFAQIQASSK